MTFSSVRTPSASVPLQSTPEPLTVKAVPSSVHLALPFLPSTLIAALPLSLSSIVKPFFHMVLMLMLMPAVSAFCAV